MAIIDVIKLKLVVEKRQVDDWYAIHGARRDSVVDRFMAQKGRLITGLKEKMGVDNLDAVTREEETKLAAYKFDQKELADIISGEISLAEPTKTLRIAAVKEKIAFKIKSAQEELNTLIGSAKSVPGHDRSEFAALITSAELEARNTNLALSEKGIIKNVEEFFTNENTSFIDNMVKLRDALGTYMASKPYAALKPEIKKEIVRDYLFKLDELLGAYNELDLHASIVDPSTSPSQAIIAIGNKLGTPQFALYANTIKALALAQQNINDIAELGQLMIGSSLLGGYTIRPPQHNQRYALQFQTIVKDLAKIAKLPGGDTSNVSTVDSRNSADLSLGKGTSMGMALQSEVGNRDSAKVAAKQMHGIATEDLQVFVLRKILDINFNSPLQPKLKESTEVDFPDGYLKAMLVKAYPDMFYLDAKQDLMVKNVRDQFDRFTNVQTALGINTNIPGAKFTFDPQNFDVIKLNELYAADKNPLWVVLKSTKPVVDDHFSALQKVEAYIELAKLLEEKAIGKGHRYQGALNLAKAAFAIAKQHPETISMVNGAFGSKSKLGEKIIDKHESREQAGIRAILTEIPPIPIVTKVILDQTKAALVAETAKVKVETTKVTTLTGRVEAQTAHVERLTTELTAANSELKGLRTELSTREQRIAALDGQLSTASSSLEGVRKELITITNERNALAQQVTRIEADKSQLVTNLSKAQKKNETLEQALQQSKSKVVDLTTQVSALTSKVGEQTEQIRTLTEVNGVLKQELTTSKAAKVTLTTELESAKESASSLTEQLQAAQSGRKALEGEVAQHKSAVAEGQAEAGKLITRVDEQAVRISTLVGDVKFLQSTTETQQSTIKAQLTELNELRPRAEATGALEDRIKILERELAHAKAAVVVSPPDLLTPPRALGGAPDASRGANEPSPELVAARKNLQAALLNLSNHGHGADTILRDFCLGNLGNIDNKDIFQLKDIMKQAKILTGITSAVNIIMSTLKMSDGWFSSSGGQKAKAIEKAMHSLPIEERIQLLKVGNLKSKAAGAQYPACDSFFKALSTQRSMLSRLFGKEESTSFTQFKSKMNDFSEEDKPSNLGPNPRN